MNPRHPRPTLVSVIAWTTLASGIVNVIWGVVALSNFIGFICAPITVLPVVLGVFEIVYAAKLLGNSAQPLRPSTNIAVFEIACVIFGNVFSMVVGILSLVFYNDIVVKDYFAGLNTLSGDEVPTPAASIPPTPSEEDPEGPQVDSR